MECVMGGKDSGMMHRATAIALVVLLHALLGHWLLRPRSSADGATVSRMTVRWVPRLPPPSPLAPTSPHSPVARSRNAAMVRTRTRSQASAQSPGMPPSAGNARPLDLSLPSSFRAAPPDATQRQPWERRREREYAPTRFDRAWAPGGGPMQQDWDFRSRAAGMLLAATGALEKECTEEDRRRRDRRCVGAQYDGEPPPPATRP